MNYTTFKANLKNFPVFSMPDIRILFPQFDRRRLTEWQEKGYICKVVKGWYTFADAEMDERMLWAIANKIYTPSYISIETALAHYNLIPESVFGVTSVSTRRTYSFQTKMATFFYRTLKPRLFFGYELLSDRTKFALPEKAILDYLYFHPSLRLPADFEALRIDPSEFKSRINSEKMNAFLLRFDSRTLSARAQAMMKWARHA